MGDVVLGVLLRDEAELAQALVLPRVQVQFRTPPHRFGGDMDAVLKTLSVSSPRGGGPAPAWAPVRHAEKPAQHVGGPRAGGGARRAIHQPR
ncbi:hypothetical protein D1007_09076 [Hordeum vulgare]|nr:hypothetical protein D1007_17558 [Hordeum vulgare]KAE8813874.1 hypothetical protein D1007_09076 [Hordeum vulgare]